MTTQKNTDTFRTVGRRKTAAARVRIVQGSGAIIINNRPLENYFTVDIWQQRVRMPLQITGKEKNFDISVRVAGGGLSAQATAVRHGIARALINWNPDLRPALKAEGFLTRDPRAKERKKPGRYKARRGHQWRKR